MDDASRGAGQLAALREELETIHFANRQYWNQQEHSHAAIAEYERRQERLEQIRKEMDELRAA